MLAIFPSNDIGKFCCSTFKIYPEFDYLPLFELLPELIRASIILPVTATATSLPELCFQQTK